MQGKLKSKPWARDRRAHTKKEGWRVGAKNTRRDEENASVEVGERGEPSQQPNFGWQLLSLPLAPILIRSNGLCFAYAISRRHHKTLICGARGPANRSLESSTVRHRGSKYRGSIISWCGEVSLPSFRRHVVALGSSWDSSLWMGVLVR